MEKKLLKKDKLAGIIKDISQDMPVWGPVKEGDNVLLMPLTEGREPLLNFQNSRNAPKALFFPRTEIMMKYTRTGKGMEFSRNEGEPEEAVLFGVRPCDARSFVLLDMLFDQDKYKDPYYIARREKTTVISMACVHPPYSTCFCTSVEGNPTSAEGADILLTDMGDNYLVEFFTSKGEKLLRYFGDLPQAGEAEETLKKEIAEKAEKEISSHVPAKDIKPILDNNFEHPFWETIHRKCIACGTCTYLCPTCHCFDISDETKGSDGIRIRNWDSCMYPLFTMETSGHNPRPTQKERWRQRVMHKFKYYVDNFGAISCVGCGRCVMYCPVNIDIRKIVEDIAKL
ncbi:MAG: 4Fe-4S dicluster domain-containing protein [Syntrophales bacterium]|nr:4Fe-4S dicluster domain-containing protein [Syntrophales bacterium]